MVRDGELLWQPSARWVERANLTAFTRRLEAEHKRHFRDYADLWQWSVDHLEEFWEAIWNYAGIESTAPYECVLRSRTMPGADWFPGARLNYARHILRQERADATALIACGELRPLRRVPWTELARDVRIAATRLRQLGVGPGDRVVGYLPNIPEAMVAMLAATSIGAIWSGSSPDFGTRSVLDRFAQIDPKVIFCVDGYRYRGKDFDRRGELAQILAQLGSLQQVIHLPYLHRDDDSLPVAGAMRWWDFMDHPPVSREEFRFEEVPFNHPLWILFSSGTTGLPKAIVHGHGGILLEQMKLDRLHLDLNAGDVMFFYTTTGWMMWNFLASSMLMGIVPVLYDGHPAHPEADAMWKIVAQTKTTLFGASPTYVQMLEQARVVPKDKYDLAALRHVMLAGSPVTAECMQWFYDNVKSDLLVGPGSGGTDICSGFVGATPTLPLYAGEIQARHLGVDAHAYNDAGQPVVDEVGEMVICQPMPSMPVCFWNDPGNVRYRESYFADFPGAWRQGDFFKVNARGGCFVLGRSDATLNRYGIRIGTAEIYRCVQGLADVEDALIVNLDLPGGRFFMPMFVKPAPGKALDDALRDKISARLKADYSPRHVPDKIYEVTAIPYTLTGKKMEVPVRRILMGMAPDKAANRGAMADPAALDYFIRFAAERRDYSLT
jgi:acetoacetyl-CoA synthetase